MSRPLLGKWYITLPFVMLAAQRFRVSAARQSIAAGDTNGGFADLVFGHGSSCF
ncbi:MAG: hypothetical protein U0936_02675 [Planctomycetaceae bacterium]